MNTQSNTRNGLARIKGEGARTNNSLNADQRWAVGKWIENNRALCEQLSADQLAAECTKQLGFNVSSCTANRQRNVVHPDLKGRRRSSKDGLMADFAEFKARLDEHDERLSQLEMLRRSSAPMRAC